MLKRFPSQLCTDHWRAIIKQEPGRETTLTGSPSEIYQLVWPAATACNPRLWTFLEGLPAAIGMTLSWA
jgi:hypothetical protein